MCVITLICTLTNRITLSTEFWASKMLHETIAVSFFPHLPTPALLATHTIATHISCSPLHTYSFWVLPHGFSRKRQIALSLPGSIIFDPGCTLLYMDISINTLSQNQHLSGQAVKSWLIFADPTLRLKYWWRCWLSVGWNASRVSIKDWSMASINTWPQILIWCKLAYM